MPPKHRSNLLFALAVLGLVVGPFAWVPGFFIGRRAVPQDTLGWLGFRICQIFTFLLLLAMVLGAIAAVVIPNFIRP